MRLLREIEISEKVATSDASWSVKYSVIFARHRDCIEPLLEQCGLHLEWTDPDASEEIDVSAYVTALRSMKSELLKLPEGCFDYQYSNNAQGLVR